MRYALSRFWTAVQLMHPDLHNGSAQRLHNGAQLHDGGTAKRFPPYIYGGTVVQ